ncbi:MAG: hypothetical protein ACOYLB_13400 [Phototrophicaceae bacterium]
MAASKNKKKSNQQYDVDHYEFEDKDKANISGVVIRFITNALLLVLSGVFNITRAVFHISREDYFPAFVVLTSGFVFIAMGFTFFNPADNLRMVLNTEGRDIEEVMNAITELADGFSRLTFFLMAMLVFEIMTTAFLFQR